MRNAASPEELAAYWPGGAENSDKGLWGWIFCLANLGRFMARLELREEAKERSEQLTTLVRQAAMSEPVAVELVARAADGSPRQLVVHPKSDIACREIHARNLQIAWLIDARDAVMGSGEPDDLELLTRALHEEGYQQRVIVWIATTPGSGLPFPEGTRAPTVPPELDDLTTLDFFSVARAFQAVHRERLAALAASGAQATKPDWAVFYALLEEELKVAARSLARDYDLPQLLATAHERGRAHADARKKAEAQAEADKRKRQQAGPRSAMSRVT